MNTDMFDLSKKNALITGSGRGIGYVLAGGLGRAGATIILNDIVEERLNTAVQLLSSEGLTVHGALFDITRFEQIEKEVARIEREIGPIDILVNNAGIQIRERLEDFPEKDWQRVLDVNLSGAFLTAKAVVKGMIQRQAGKIINICSIQSELGRATITPYTAAKGGLKMLTRGMATEWGKHNIQINGLGPGYFITDMTRPLAEDEEFDAWLRGRTPANRWGNVEELIGPIVFLASDATSYVNGHILYVDGGMLVTV